jgi:hypothetical protein
LDLEDVVGLGPSCKLEVLGINSCREDSVDKVGNCSSNVRLFFDFGEKEEP